MRRRFTPDEIKFFLEAVDRYLPGPARVTIIGGSAAALAYSVMAGTADVDTFETNLAALATTFEKAREVSGLHIPVQPAPAGDLPWNYEARLVRVLPHLARLEVYVPERHDLVLSKTLRCHEGDLQCAEEMHALDPLALDVLVERFVNEMDHVIGHPRRVRHNFLVCIERLFGEAVADRVETKFPGRRSDASRWPPS